MEFMISNNVEFTQDPSDGMFVATIRIVNKVNGSQNIKAYEEQKDEYSDPPPSSKPSSSSGPKNPTNNGHQHKKVAEAKPVKSERKPVEKKAPP